jgi:hypothetical protein
MSDDVISDEVTGKESRNEALFFVKAGRGNLLTKLTPGDKDSPFPMVPQA